MGCLKKRCQCLPVFLLLALVLLRVLVVGVRHMLGRVDCYKACNLVLGSLCRGFPHAQVLLGGRRLLLHVVRTNGIVDYLLVNVCGWLGRLRCRYVLPRYDLTQADAPRARLVLGLCRCSFMSG